MICVEMEANLILWQGVGPREMRVFYMMTHLSQQEHHSCMRVIVNDPNAAIGATCSAC